MSRATTKPISLPTETTVLGLLERNARAAVARASLIAEPLAKGFAPKSAGRRRQGPGRSPEGLEGAIESKIRRTPTGVRSTTSVDRRKAFYGGFVEAGTVKIEGEHYLRRAELFAQDSADRVIEDGAERAARELERLQ